MLNKIKLKEAEKFYQEHILGWMINDLKNSVQAETNFLTALGCFVYTEVIGTFLPSLDISEMGKTEEIHFYRCFFRLRSSESLKQLDEFIRKETSGKSLYSHLRNGMAHSYFPNIKKTENGEKRYIHSVIARDGIANKPDGTKMPTPPIFIDNDSRLIIANRNYIDELEFLVRVSMNMAFVKNDSQFQEAAERGIDIISGR